MRSSRAGESGIPRAVIHKQILDAAEARPSASAETLAADVSGASAELVERVLAEYGDPSAEEHEEPVPNGGVESESREESSDAAEQTPQPEPPDRSPGRSDIPEKTLRTLQTIYENPDASQADLAEEFGVARSTINRWLNSVTGFDWENRHEFARSVVEGTPLPATARGDDDFEDGFRRLAALERRVDALDSRRVCFDPELAHKVVHACIESDRIDETEELELLKALMGSRG